MTTAKQIEANRRNAQRSTGPRTAEGRACVSQNRAKRGFFAPRTLVPGESLDEYDALVRSLERDLKPYDALERGLVRQIASAEWRLNRAVEIETGMFSERFDHLRKCRDLPLNQPLEASQHSKLLGGLLVHDAQGDSLSKLSRYEMRLSRRYFAVLAHLEAVQDRRRRLSRKSARKSTKKK